MKKLFRIFALVTSVGVIYADHGVSPDLNGNNSGMLVDVIVQFKKPISTSDWQQVGWYGSVKKQFSTSV